MLLRLFDRQNFIGLFSFFSIWKYGKDFLRALSISKKYMIAFLTLEVLKENGADGQYLHASHSMVPSGFLWLGKWKAIKGLHVGVEIRQGCVLFLLSFMVYMKWIDKCSQADECSMIENSKISCLLFADDSVLLPQNLAFSAY